MESTDIKKIGVVGCGIMGGGIVETAAAAGYEVVAAEVSRRLPDAGRCGRKAKRGFYDY